MNTVNSSIYGLSEFNFNNLHFFTKYTLIFFMIIGRIELLTILLLNVFSIRAFNSLNLAFTLISSGGFLPVNDLSTIIKQNSQIIVLSILMLTSFFSIFFSYNLIFFKNKNLNFFYEDLHLIIYLISLIAIFLLFFSFNSDFSKNLLSISTSISNIGFSIQTDQKKLIFIYFIKIKIDFSKYQFIHKNILGSTK